MKAKKLFTIVSFFIITTLSSFAQPAWYGGTPFVTPNALSINFDYGINEVGTVYVILINYNYTTPVPTSAQVQAAAIAGPAGGRISTWVISIPAGNIIQF